MMNAAICGAGFAASRTPSANHRQTIVFWPCRRLVAAGTQIPIRLAWGVLNDVPAGDAGLLAAGGKPAATNAHGIPVLYGAGHPPGLLLRRYSRLHGQERRQPGTDRRSRRDDIVALVAEAGERLHHRSLRLFADGSATHVDRRRSVHDRSWLPAGPRSATRGARRSTAWPSTS